MAEGALRIAEEEEAASLNSEGKRSTSSSRSKTTPKTNVKALQQRVSALQEYFEEKIEKLFSMLQHTAQPAVNSQHKEGLALPAEFDNEIVVPQKSQQPIISLNNGNDKDIVSADIVSIQLGEKERKELLGLEDATSIHSSESCSRSKHIDNRYLQYSNPQTPVLLNELFGSNRTSLKDASGIILDGSQIDSLNSSWRSDQPDRLKAYKEEHKMCFPIHGNSKTVLEVPGLDDLLEPMLQKRHRITKAWGKSRHLCTQPFKSIEMLGYQGQLSAKYGITAIAYMQQGLGKLLATLKEKEPNIDRNVQTVRDLFEMSNKALDRTGRAGAFHHMIRRKAAVTDSGLSTLKDVHVKVMHLPLSSKSVFGPGLQSVLKDRKERKEQLSDLVPEIFEQSYSNKRKSSFNNVGSSYKKAENKLLQQKGRKWV